MVRRGFSLVELLVVIAIVIILAILLLGVFGEAQGKARQTTCLSNVRQLTGALSVYALDYDQTLPLYRADYPSGLWVDVISGYLSLATSRFCPAEGKHDAEGSYGYNLGTRGSDDFNYDGPAGRDVSTPVPLAMVAQPTDTIAVGDRTMWSTPASLFRFDPEVPGALGLCDTHGGGGNYGFLDGHAARLAQDEAYGQRGLFTVAED